MYCNLSQCCEIKFCVISFFFFLKNSWLENIFGCANALFLVSSFSQSVIASLTRLLQSLLLNILLKIWIFHFFFEFSRRKVILFWKWPTNTSSSFWRHPDLAKERNAKKLSKNLDMFIYRRVNVEFHVLNLCLSLKSVHIGHKQPKSCSGATRGRRK